MIKVYNNIIPAKGFMAMTIWPLLFIKKKEAWRFNANDERHENIHGEQQKEMLAVGGIIAACMLLLGCGWWSLVPIPLFFWWYLTEWLLRLIFGKGNAYRNISFEREAFGNEKNEIYLAQRKRFAWVKYITKG